MEGIQYCGGIPSVLWGDNSSTCGGIPSVLWRLFSTVGDNISTVEDSFSTVGIPPVLWRLFSTVGDNISTVGDSFSTVEGIQYIGGITSVHVGG